MADLAEWLEIDSLGAPDGASLTLVDVGNGEVAVRSHHDTYLTCGTDFDVETRSSIVRVRASNSSLSPFFCSSEGLLSGVRVRIPVWKLGWEKWQVAT